MDNNLTWVSDTDSDKELLLTDEEKKDIVIQGIILNIIEMKMNDANELIQKNNIDINDRLFDYVYNEKKGQVLYGLPLLEWCLRLYQDNLYINEFNHEKLYDFICYLIKEKVNLDDTSPQIQDTLEIISDSMGDIYINYQNNINEEKHKMMLKQLSDIDRKLTFLWAHICNVNERSTVYNYT